MGKGDVGGRFAAASYILALIVLLLILAGLMVTDDVKWHNTNTRFDSELGWAPIVGRSVMDFGTKKVSSNSLGFRSPELDPSKNHVIILGDSVAWGYGLADNETVSYYLQEYLDRNAVNLQVQNLAVSGYGIDQYYLYLKKHINATNPKHIVVVICTNNDITEFEKDVEYRKSKPLFALEGGKLVNINTGIKKHTCSNTFSNSLLVRSFPLLSEVGKYCPRRKYQDDEFRIKSALIDEIRSLADSHNSTLLFVISPNLEDYYLAAPRTDFANAQRFFYERNYTYMDIYNLTRDSGIDIPGLYLEEDDTHYSAAGSRYMAEKIFLALNSS